MPTPDLTKDTGKLVFTTEIHPRWSDQDRLGHVNNAEYFRYFEEARIRWLDSLAQSFPVEMDRSKSGPVVATTGCTYLQPVVYPCPLLCSLYIVKVGNSSLSIRQTLTTLENLTLMTEGHVTFVWVDRVTGKSTLLPAQLRQLAL